jgi:hypothetical protein
MDTIFHRLQRNIEKINESSIMDKVLKSQDVLDKMADLQRSQLLSGKNANGEGLGVYSKNTQWRNSVRTTKVTAGNPIVLKDTNAFQSKIQAVAEKDKAKLTSTDDKTNLLMWGYGPQIFGLSPEYMQNLRDYMKSTEFLQRAMINIMLYGN